MIKKLSIANVLMINGRLPFFMPYNLVSSSCPANTSTNAVAAICVTPVFCRATLIGIIAAIIMTLPQLMAL